MGCTVLITGFGPFPGAPFNPTGPLVIALARRRDPAFIGVRRVSHVFRTSYEAVDRELPMLLAREKPDALLMFGLAQSARHIRVETRARNALARLTPDADGLMPRTGEIALDAPATLPLRTPARRLAAAARSAGVTAVLSDNAGSYLCNYLCWRAGETTRADGGPPVVAFVHVPRLRGANPLRSLLGQPTFLPDDLLRAGRAIALAAIAAARGELTVRAA